MYPSFDSIFLFDHSCGHDHSREGGLKSSIMRNHFGGKQQNMIDTVMLIEDRFLVPYGRILAT